MANLIVCLSIRRCRNKFMNITMWEHCNFDTFLDVEIFTALTPLSLLILCKLSFPVVGLKVSFISTLALKSRYILFIL
jgi:hypothetical protein